MPKNIARFERLMYGSIVTGVLVAVLGLDRLDTLLGVYWVLGATATHLAGYSWMTWLVARRHKSWPRWMLLVGFVFDLPLFFGGLGELFGESVLSGTLVLVQRLLHALALCCVFSAGSREWLSAAAAPPAAGPPQSSAYRRAASVLIVAMFVAAGVSLISFPALTASAAMGCIPNCSGLQFMSIELIPVALAAGAILGWRKRSRGGFGKLICWTLGPITCDVALYAIGVAITNSLRV